MSAIAAPAGLRTDVQVISLVGLAHGVSHFFQLLLAPLFPWIRAELGLSYAELGSLMAMFFIVSGVGQAAAGFVVDRLGARRVLTWGLGLLTLGALVAGLSSGYWGLALGAVIIGMGNCVFHPADFTLLNRRVSHGRLAHAFSVHGITGNLGYAAAPVFMIGITELTGSWRVAILSATAVGATVLVLVALNRRLLEDRAVAAAPRESTDTAGADPMGSSFGFLRLPQVWMCFVFFFAVALSMGGVQAFVAPALNQLYGMPLTVAALAFTTYMLCSAGGMLIGGFLAARTVDHERLIAISLIGAGALAALLGVAILPAIAVLPVMGLIGFASGMANPSRDMLVRAAAPPNATGRVYGMVYSGLDSGMAIAPVLFGVVMDAMRPGWVFYGMGGFLALAVLAALIVGGDSRRRREPAATVAA